MGDPKPCACGHSVEAHEAKRHGFGDTSCDEDGCDCIAYEADEDYDADGKVI